jgi:hypothetical protein
MKRTTASLLYAALLLGTGAGIAQAIGLDTVDTFGLDGELDPAVAGDGAAALNVVTGRFAAPPAGAGPPGAAAIARGVGVPGVDEAELVRIDLSRKAGRAVPTGPGGADSASVPAGAGRSAVTGGQAGARAQFSVSCRLTGAQRDRVACTLRPAGSTAGIVRISLSRAGRPVARGEGIAAPGARPSCGCAAWSARAAATR